MPKLTKNTNQSLLRWTCGDRVSDCFCLTQIFHWDDDDDDWWYSLCTLPTFLVGIFTMLALRICSPQVDMSLQFDTLFWFWGHQSLLFHLNAMCLVKKQQILILQSLVWLNRWLNPISTILNITIRMWFLWNIERKILDLLP